MSFLSESHYINKSETHYRGEGKLFFAIKIFFFTNAVIETKRERERERER